jgi:hypothetical protein
MGSPSVFFVFRGRLASLSKATLLLQSAVSFFLLKLTYSDLNNRFDMNIIFITNYFLRTDDVLIDNETLLITDFMNFKIKPIQSFKVDHMVEYAYICL